MVAGPAAGAGVLTSWTESYTTPKGFLQDRQEVIHDVFAAPSSIPHHRVDKLLRRLRVFDIDRVLLQ